MGLTKTQALSGKQTSCFDCLGGSSFPYFPTVVTAIDLDGCLSVSRNSEERLSGKPVSRSHGGMDVTTGCDMSNEKM